MQPEEMFCTKCRDQCPLRDVTLCVLCNELLCVPCEQSHACRKLGCKVHDFINLFSEKRASGRKYCMSHSEERVTHFCRTCSLSFCDECAKKREHDSHTVVFLNSYLPHLQEALKGCRTMLQWKEKQISQSVHAITTALKKSEHRKNEIKHKIKEALHDVTIQFLAAIKERERSLHEQLNSLCNEQNEELYGCLENANVFLSVMQQANQMVTNNIIANSVVFQKGFFEKLAILNRADITKVIGSSDAMRHHLYLKPSKASTRKSAIQNLTNIGIIQFESKDSESNLNGRARENENSSGYAVFQDKITLPFMGLEELVDDMSIGETDPEFGEYHMLDRLIKVPSPTYKAQSEVSYLPDSNTVTEDISILNETEIPDPNGQSHSKANFLRRLPKRLMKIKNPLNRNKQENRLKTKSPVPTDSNEIKSALRSATSTPTVQFSDDNTSHHQRTAITVHHSGKYPPSVSSQKSVYHQNKPKVPNTRYVPSRLSQDVAVFEDLRSLYPSKEWNIISPPNEQKEDITKCRKEVHILDGYNQSKNRRPLLRRSSSIGDLNSELNRANIYRPPTAPPRRHTMWPPETTQDEKEIFVDDALTDDNYGTYPRLRVKHNDNSKKPFYLYKYPKNVRGMFQQAASTKNSGDSGKQRNAEYLQIGERPRSNTPTGRKFEHQRKQQNIFHNTTGRSATRKAVVVVEPNRRKVGNIDGIKVHLKSTAL